MPRRSRGVSLNLARFWEKGLYLEGSPSGGKWWRLKYRFAGKEKLLSMGTYPDTSLKGARDKRDRARALLAEGVDPSATRRAEKESRSAAVNSFEAVAREWHTTIHLAQVSAGHAARTLIRLEQDVFPWLGGVPVGEIKAPQLLQAMRRIEARGAIETAHRALQACGQVFRYAIATGRAERDPTPDLRGALKPVLVQHMAAITDPQRVGDLLRAIESYKVSGVGVIRQWVASAGRNNFRGNSTCPNSMYCELVRPGGRYSIDAGLYSSAQDRL